jgi:hypothetical protein
MLYYNILIDHINHKLKENLTKTFTLQEIIESCKRTVVDTVKGLDTPTISIADYLERTTLNASFESKIKRKDSNEIKN